MADPFGKLLADVRLSDLNEGLAKPAPIRYPTPTEQLRLAGAGGGVGQSSLLRLVRAQQRALERQQGEGLTGLPGIAVTPGGPMPTIPPWEQFRSQIADFDKLDFPKQNELYEQYVSQAAGTLKQWNPALDIETLDTELRTRNPAPEKPIGDFARGLKQYLPQTKGTLAGAAGLALSKLGYEEEGKAWLTQAQGYFEEANKLSRESDQFLTSVKAGPGALADWAQYVAGQLTGNLLESLAVAGAGAVGGAIAGSAVAPGIGTLGGGIAAGATSLLGKTLVKKEIRDAVASEIAELTAKKIRGGMAEAAAKKAAQEAVAKKLNAEAGKTLGSTLALFGAAETRGVGEIVQQAQQAGIDPTTLDTSDVALGATVYGLAETVGDKLLLGAFGKPAKGSLRERATTGGRVARATMGAALTGGGEGATEVAQDVVTRLTATGAWPTLEENANAFFAGLLGGGVVGGGGALARGAPAPPPPAPNVAAEVLGTPPAAPAAESPPPSTPAAPASPAAPPVDVATAQAGFQAATTALNTALEGGDPDAVAAAAQAVVDAETALESAQQGTAQPEPELIGLAEPPATPSAPPADAAQVPRAVQARLTRMLPQDANRITPLADGRFSVRTAAGQREAATLQEAEALTGTEPDVDVSAGIAALEAQLAPLRQRMAAATEPSFAELQDAARILRAAPLEVQQAAQHSNEPAIRTFVRTLGIEQSLAANPHAQWAVDIRRGADLQTILASAPVSDGNTNSLRWISGAFTRAGIPLPRVVFDPNPQPDANGNVPRGTYNADTHTVTFNPRTSLNAVAHELMHALTLRGLNRTIRLARGGARISQDILALVNELHEKLRAQARQVRRNTYGNDNIAEMYAELVRPEFLALAAQTPLGTLSPAAKRALSTIRLLNQSGQRSTVLEAITRLVDYLMNLVSPGAPTSLANVLQETAAHFMTNTAGTFDLDSGATPTPAAPAALTPDQVRNRLRDPNGSLSGEELLAIEAANPPGFTPGERTALSYFNQGLINITELRQRFGVSVAPAAPTPTAAPVYTAVLPAWANRSNPRWNSHQITFDNDVDRALYIVRPGRSNDSARHNDFVAWLTSLGFTTAQRNDSALAVYRAVREAVGRTSTNTERVRIPSVNRVPVNTAAATTAAATPDRADSAPLRRLGASRTGRFRGVQAAGALGTLISENTTAAQRQRHFLQAVRDGIDAVVAGPNPHGLMPMAAGDTRIRFRNGNSGSLYPNGGEVSAVTSGLDIGSGEGGVFYDIAYGAAVSARVRFTYGPGSLSEINVRRLPVNRLRAALKWGTITGDLTNAVDRLGLISSAPYGVRHEVGFAGLLRTVQRVVSRGLTSADAANVTLTPQLDAFLLNGQRMTFEEMRELTGRRRNYDEKAASFSVVSLIAISNRLQGSSRQNELIERINQIPEFSDVLSLDESTEGPTASITTPVPGATPLPTPEDVVAQGAENLTGPTSISQRRTYAQQLANVQSGQRAPAATPIRAVVQNGQAILQGTPAQQQQAVQALRQQSGGFADWLNEKLADSLIVVKRWIQSLPIDPLQTQGFLSALYRAPGVRNELLSKASLVGAQALNKQLARIVSKYKITEETAKDWVGNWITAQSIPDRNAYLLRRAQRELQALLRGNPTPRAVREATAELIALQQAINNPQTANVRHPGKLAGSMNNAQAALLSSEIENRIDLADLQAAAAHVYDLNAWRLAIDIETGKTAPSTATRFLENPAIRADLVTLRQLALAADAANANSLRALEAQRERVMQLVRSKYVPLTGDPNAPIDAELFYTGGRAPNTAQDRRIEGRSSFPDDAISTTMAAINKSASYAGWRDFQTALVNAYRSMTPDQRKAAGIRRTVLSRGGVRAQRANRVGPDSVVVRRGGTVVAYEFADKKILEAVRGTNIRFQDNPFVEGIGRLTRAYAYGATQLNPFFAPFNFFRDSWERSEIIRTRTYIDASGNEIEASKIANGMLGILTKPGRNFPLTKTLWQWGLGLKPNASYEADMLEEFISAGGTSLYSATFSAERKKLIADIAAERGGPRAALRKLGDLVSIYNKPFDIAPAFAAYMSMRENGMSPKDAAAGSLDLMNFRKKGTEAPILRALYAFSGPTFTGAANSLGALFHRDGSINRIGWKRLVGYTLVFAAAQAFFRSLADDDEGGNKLDQESPFLQNNYMLIPIGDGILKIPLAYGLTRLANGVARASVGIATDEQTVGEAAGRVASGSVVPIFSPLEDSDIDWTEKPVQALFTLFAPSWAKPMFAVGFNTAPWGSKVVEDKWEDTTRYRSEQFGKFSPPFYKEVAQFIRQAGGPDFAPEEVRTLVRGYPTGIFNLVLTGMVEKPHKGKEFGDAFTDRFYAEPSEYARYFQFKKAIDTTDDQLKAKDAGEEFDGALVAWRERWDAIDQDLRSDKASITRKKNKGTLSDAAAAQAYAQLEEARRQQQYLALYKYRVLTGKPAVRTEIPSAWRPRDQRSTP
jgi:hypothetical protein